MLKEDVEYVVNHVALVDQEAVPRIAVIVQRSMQD